MGTKAGLNKYFKPDDILSFWEEYKKQVDDNPFKEEVLSNKGEVVTLNRPNPYTRQGFEVFVHKKTGHGIDHYIDNFYGKYNDYLEIVSRIRKEWQDNQISGSLTGKYKAPNLVARLNGLSDNNNVNVTEKPIFNGITLDDVTNDDSSKEDS